MQNIFVIGIYAPFCILTAVIFGIELFRHYKRQEDYLFTLLCFLALGWYLVVILSLSTTSVEVAKFCNNFMLVFVSLIPPTLLLFIIKFYKIDDRINLSKISLVLLYLVPFINLIMIFTADKHTFLNRQLEIISFAPYREIQLVWGPWFWIHTLYCYAISMTIILLLVLQHFRQARFYRVPSTMMLLGVCLTLVGNITTLLQIVPPVFEPSLITMSLSIILFSLAIINNNSSKFVRYSRSHIYHYLAEYILVLNEKDQVIDYNSAAEKWFASLEITLEDASFEAVTQSLLQKGEFVQSEAAEQEENGIDIHIQSNSFQMVLNQRVYQMKDVRNDSIGKIVVYNDVTQNRMLIERLETKAGMDSLTGIANHMTYKGAKARLDAPQYLPLSVIVCDANGLKEINDNMGHEYGDLLLQTIADVFEGLCPKDGFVARTGGDEFIFLLPNTLPEGADYLIAQVKERTGALSDLPFTMSVAMGTAAKFQEQVDLDRVIALADERMYEVKKRMKGLG